MGPGGREGVLASAFERLGATLDEPRFALAFHGPGAVLEEPELASEDRDP